MKTKPIFLIFFVLALMIGATGCEKSTPTPESANMPNPASVFCEEQGGKVEIRTGEDGSQYGMCVMPAGECDEWAFYRGECVPGQPVDDQANMANPASVYCVEQGGQVEMRTDENGGQYGVCVLPTGECDEWAFYRGECVPDQPVDDQANMANPASVFCVEQGGQVEMRVDENGGEYGMCVLPAGECEEWAFFRGECLPGVILPNEIGYSSEEYGFSFAAAPDFSLDAHANYLVYKHIAEGYQIVIGFQWKDGEILPVRTGMPEGDFQDAEPVHLLGQELPKKLLVFEGKSKVAVYGPVEVGDLRMVFYLDAPYPEGSVYPDIELTQEMQAAAQTLIASFAMLDGSIPTVAPPQ